MELGTRYFVGMMEGRFKRYNQHMWEYHGGGLSLLCFGKAKPNVNLIEVHNPLFERKFKTDGTEHFPPVEGIEGTLEFAQDLKARISKEFGVPRDELHIVKEQYEFMDQTT